MAKRPKREEDFKVYDGKESLTVEGGALEVCHICPYPGDCKRAGRCRNKPQE